MEDHRLPWPVTAPAAASQDGGPRSTAPAASVLDAGLLLRIAEEASAAIAVVQGADHRIIYANVSFRALNPAPDANLIGRTIGDVFPQLRQRELARLDKAYAAARPLRYRGWAISRPSAAQGEVWNVDLLPIGETEDRMRGLALMLYSVTAVVGGRERTGRTVAEPEEEARRILESLLHYIPTGVVIADAPDGTIRAVSRYASTITGRPILGLVGVPWEKHVARWGVLRKDGSVPAAAELPLARAIRCGEVTMDEEWVLQRPDGEQVPVLCDSSPIRDEAGATIGGIVSWRDMRALERAMAAQREAEESLQVALQAADMASWDLDLVTGESWRSLRHDRIFGYDEPRRDWTIADFLAHVIEEERARVAAHFEGSTEGLQFECRIRQAETGEVRWIAVSGRICSDDRTHEPCRLAAIVQDITEGKTADAALRQAAEQALRADRAVLDAISARAQTLTPRQRQVMALVTAGHPNKEIAHRLGLSERTVEGHRAQVMNKMQAESLADLVRMAGAVGVGPSAPAAAPGSRDEDNSEA